MTTDIMSVKQRNRLSTPHVWALIQLPLEIGFLGLITDNAWQPLIFQYRITQVGEWQ